VVPVCFAIAANSLFITIDEKPKHGPPAKLRRLRNIAENPAVSVVIDRYDDDWIRLGWVMIRGRAEILFDCPERAEAHARLRTRYPQYRTMTLEGLPVIAVRIERVTSWGNLS
jgi:PPOX class probable F420-dependent enzyme